MMIIGNRDPRLSGIIEDDLIIYKGAYSTSETYPKNSLVTDAGGTYISLTETTDKPSPVEQGTEEYVFDDGILTPNSTNGKQLTIGQRYTAPADTSVKVKGFKINTVVGNHYIVYYVENSTTNPVINFLIEFDATISGENELNLDNFIVQKGTSFDIVVIINEPDPTPVVNSTSYNYIKNTNLTIPNTGQITHSNKETDLLLVHKTSEDGDFSVELGEMTIGDIIEGGGIRWSIQSIVDNTSYIEFSVAPATQGVPAGSQIFNFEKVAETPISYEENIGAWTGVGTVNGLFIVDGRYADIVPDDNQYIIDLKIVEVVQSDHWDALLGGGVGSSGGTSQIGSIEEVSFKELMKIANFSDQIPPALDTPIQVNLNDGVERTSADGEVTVDADGTMIFNEVGTYYIQHTEQVYKDNSPGTLNSITYATVDVGAGDQINGLPSYSRIPNQNTNSNKDFTRIVDVPIAGLKYKIFYYNDTDGNGVNTGGLKGYETASGTGPLGIDIPDVPSSSTTIKIITNK